MSADPTWVPGQEAADTAEAWLRIDRMIRIGALSAQGVQIDVARAREVLRVCAAHGIEPKPDAVARLLRELLTTAQGPR